MKTYQDYISHLDMIAIKRPLNGICKGIRDAHYENQRLKEALAETRLLWGKIFKQYTSRQHATCNQAAKIIDEALKG